MSREPRTRSRQPAARDIEPTQDETHEFAVRSARYLADHGYAQHEIAEALEEELPVGPVEAGDAARVAAGTSSRRVA